MSLGEMAYAVLYTLHLTLALLFQQKKQVLEPIKMSHGHLKAVSAIKVHNLGDALILSLLLISLAVGL
jgi:hypothetical protein